MKAVTTGTVAAMKAVAATAAAAAVKAAAHSGTEAALSPVAAEFGAGEQGEPLVFAHTESSISAELPSATATASQHSEGISTGVKPVSASRSEPEQLSQHDAVLHELEAALSELAAAEEQVEPEGEQLQLAVDATAQELEPGEVTDQLSVGGGACSKWHSKRSFRGSDSIKGPSDDMLQHGRWLCCGVKSPQYQKAQIRFTIFK